MTNKLFGTKQITHLIYGLVMLLPFLSILGRTMYTIVNKNAKDSYSDTYVKSESELALSNTLNDGFTYKMTYDGSITTGSTSSKLIYSDISIDWTEYGASNAYNYDRFYIQIYGNAPSTMIYLYNSDGAPLQQLYNVWGYSLKSITFVKETSQNIGSGPYKIFTEIMQKEPLDNAFEYSLSQFTEDNNIGSVDFFSWFTDLFLDQDNSHNAIYLNFVNWYMNYALLTSSGYLLFLCLLWFVNYVRRILDKSMNHDMGGF